MLLIRWSKIANPKHNGEPGIRNPELVNLTLITKLVQRFLSAGDALWRQLPEAKYLGSDIFWEEVSSPTCSPLWKGILWSRVVLKPSCIWRIGDGLRVLIWNDPQSPLCEITDSRVADPLLSGSICKGSHRHRLGSLEH